MTVNLREIDDDNRAAVAALDVTDVQHNYIAGVSESLDDAEAYPHAAPRYWAIYDDDAPVGFVMISDNVPPTDDPGILGPYFLWRLLIDIRYQGRGHGRAAMALVIDYVRTRPGATELLTSVHPGEAESPMGFYRKLGFIDTGVDHIDTERIMRLPLH